MSDCEYLTEPIDEEQERPASGFVHPAVRSYMYSPMGGDSDSPDEATVKCTNWPEGAIPAARTDSSDTESSSTSEDESDEREYKPRDGEGDYRTLTPSRRLDNSSRRDDNFKWMPTGTMVDEVQETTPDTRAEECSAESLERRRRAPTDRHDRDRKSRSSLTSKPPTHPSSVRASPRPRRPRDEETPPELQRRWNSYEHFRWPEGGWWPPMCWCHGPPVPPPCYMHDRAWPSHTSLPHAPARGYKVRVDVNSLQSKPNARTYIPCL